MKLTTGQYASVLLFQTILFWFDFILNAFATNVNSNAGSLIIFIVQGLGIILSISSLLLTFFSTYVFQAGLVDILYNRFKSTLLICMLYFILTIVLHVWNLTIKWNSPKSSTHWPSGILVIFILQRLCSPFYYYFFKRTALRISDPRFYADAMWDEKRFNESENNIQYQSQ